MCFPVNLENSGTYCERAKFPTYFHRNYQKNVKLKNNFFFMTYMGPYFEALMMNN